MNCRELIEVNAYGVEYSIQLLERVEDWYISEIDIDDYGHFDSLLQALAAFEKYCIKLITNNISTADLDEAIGHHFSDEIDDDEYDISDWSMGYVLSLKRDKNTLISLFFDYDFKAKLISNSYIVEFDKAELSAFDLSNLFSRLKLQCD